MTAVSFRYEFIFKVILNETEKKKWNEMFNKFKINILNERYSFTDFRRIIRLVKKILHSTVRFYLLFYVFFFL